MIWAALFVTTGLLLVSPGLESLPKRIVRVYGVYFLIAYALRSVVLVILNPQPELNSSFAIAALTFPDYATSLESVLPYPIASAWGLYFAVLFGCRLLRIRQVTIRVPVTSGLLAVSYGIGYLCVLVSLLGPSDPLLERVSTFGQAITSACLAGLIMGRPWRETSRNLVYVLCSLEALLSIGLASKTPILTVLLLLYLDGKRPRPRLRSVLMTVLVTVGAFTAVQQLKPTSNVLEGSNIAEKAFYSITARLDGLYSMAESWNFGPSQYQPDGGVLGMAVRGFVPGWLQGQKLLSGELWGINVYGVYNGTSYAEGLPAEGFVMVGPYGSVIWGVLGGLFIVGAVKLVASKRLFLEFSGFGFIASTAIYERGVMGQIEQISSALQAAILISALIILLNSRHQSVDRSRVLEGFAPTGRPTPRAKRRGSRVEVR